MGNWNINIQGIGCHHNTDYPNDADKLAAQFVQDLIKAGQSVEAATFTSGGKIDLLKLQQVQPPAPLSPTRSPTEYSNPYPEFKT